MYLNWKLGLQVCTYSNSQLGKYLAKLIWGTCAAISYKIKQGESVAYWKSQELQVYAKVNTEPMNVCGSSG